METSFCLNIYTDDVLKTIYFVATIPTECAHSMANVPGIGYPQISSKCDHFQSTEVFGIVMVIL